MNTRELIQYCRAHDWGKAAEMVNTLQGTCITGLTKLVTGTDGQIRRITVTLPADYDYIRAAFD